LENVHEAAISWQDFQKVEMRVGTIVKAEIFEGVRKPAYKIHIDFGALGIRKTSAQVTKRYTPEQLIDKQVVAVVNFPPKQIANFMSECLVLGTLGEDNDITLLSPEQTVENGLRIG
jgi:tRNA-binding protein